MQEAPKLPPHILASGHDAQLILNAIARVDQKADLVIALLRLSIKQEMHLAHELDTLESEVSQLDGVVPSVLALLDRLAVQIANAGTDPARLQKVTTDLMARRQALAEAVAKGTAAEDEVENPTAPAVAPTISTISPISGMVAGGEPVVITGTGFTGATAVTFGDAGSTYNIDSDTQITANTPAAAAGPSNITVVGPNGSATAPTPFTYA